MLTRNMLFAVSFDSFVRCKFRYKQQISTKTTTNAETHDGGKSHPKLQIQRPARKTFHKQDCTTSGGPIAALPTRHLPSVLTSHPTASTPQSASQRRTTNGVPSRQTGCPPSEAIISGRPKLTLPIEQISIAQANIHSELALKWITGSASLQD